MTIQSQVLTKLTFTSLIYKLERDLRKPRINKLSRSKTPKAQQLSIGNIRENPVNILVATNRGGMLAQAKILPI